MSISIKVKTIREIAFDLCKKAYIKACEILPLITWR